ncbi:MAG: hypothetical protein WBG13_28440 [Pseudolabrys sp.]
MELASEFIIGIGGLVIGLAMLWFGMPNKGGENPRFFSLGFVQMVYPAIVLLFFVIGVAEL